VLGHRGSGDGQLLGQLPDRAGASGEQLEERPPGWVAEQAQTIRSVSVH
jgi:hypothetical protein